MHHHYFEKELTDLQAEIGEHHPNVLAILTSLTDKDIYMQLSAIAVHCGIILHGDYTKEDMLGLCKKMTEILVEKRTIHVQGIILPDNFQP